MQFIDVEDFAEGHILALRAIAKNKIYNLDGKDKITIKQIAETVRKLIGGVKIKSVPARPGDFSGKEVSSELAKRELGWEPKVSLEEGLRRYIEWHKKEEAERESKWAQIDEILKS
jgi:UDP-glucose 4-epimerase